MGMYNKDRAAGFAITGSSNPIPGHFRGMCFVFRAPVRERSHCVRCELESVPLLVQVSN